MFPKTRYCSTDVVHEEPEDDLQILINKVAQMGYQTEYYTAISKNFDLPYDTSKQSSRTDIVDIIYFFYGFYQTILDKLTNLWYNNKRNKIKDIFYETKMEKIFINTRSIDQRDNDIYS